MSAIIKTKILTTFAALLLALVTLASCHTSVNVTHDHEEQAEHAESTEPAPYMIALQHYSAKLGYAINARNARLAEFYLHEVEEVLEELIEKVPQHDDLPVAQFAQTILVPELPPLHDVVDSADWPAADARYLNLIDACNRCHGSTQHEYIIITPATGPPPFNQQFTPNE
jgi:hypothetical protein